MKQSCAYVSVLIVRSKGVEERNRRDERKLIKRSASFVLCSSWMGPYVCAYLSECIYKTDQFPPVWKWIDPRTFWLSLFTPPNAPDSSRPQTNEGRVLAAQRSDMKDSETIKDIVPFFSLLERTIFFFIFSFLLRRTKK